MISRTEMKRYFGKAIRLSKAKIRNHCHAFSIKQPKKILIMEHGSVTNRHLKNVTDSISLRETLQ